MYGQMWWFKADGVHWLVLGDSDWEEAQEFLEDYLGQAVEESNGFASPNNLIVPLETELPVIIGSWGHELIRVRGD